MTETGCFSSFPSAEQETASAWPRTESSPVSFVHNKILKVEIAHRGDNTSVRKTDICYRRKHILCGLFKAVAILGIER